MITTFWSNLCQIFHYEKLDLRGYQSHHFKETSILDQELKINEWFPFVYLFRYLILFPI